MKKTKLLAGALCLSLGLSSCVYADVTSPLDVDFQNTELGTKSGESHNYSVFWAVAWGDGGARKAAEDGGIKTITHADRRVISVLWGLWTRVTTIVYGE